MSFEATRAGTTCGADGAVELLIFEVGGALTVGGAAGGGLATQLGAASVHPFPIAPKIADLAVSSVTHAAESYFRGIAEPTVQ